MSGDLLSGLRLPPVSVSEVAAFLAVVDCGGFTAAARRLHLSQPGVSSRVQRLERALGVTLIDRSVRRVTLTAEGRAFLPQAHALVAALLTGVHRAQAAQVAGSDARPAASHRAPATNAAKV